MAGRANPRVPETSDDPREISKWARIYAQNRTLGVVVGMVAFLILWAAISIPSYFGGMAYRYSNFALFWGCIAILVVAMVALVYFSVPKWGGKLIERITERLYTEEGHVQVMPPPSRRRRWIGKLVGAVFGASVVASVVLGFLLDIPVKYMQPISAIYCVPFCLALWLLQRPATMPIMLLWPALYALHAILIVAGAPIVFGRPWESLNMLIPVAGYGLLTALIAHLYSRFALRKLRRLAGGLPGERESAEELQP